MTKEKVKYLDHNMKGEDYIIGDLHGCLDLFNRGLDKIGFNKERDRIISVGDLIDRGPDSYGCLQLMYEPWFECVKGNHEQMMQEELLDNIHGNWMYNGGGWVSEAIEQYGNESLKEDARHIKELPLVIVIGKDSDNRINVVHAEFYQCNTGVMPVDADIDMWNFDELHEDGLVWGRNIIQLEKIWTDDGSHNYGLSLTYVGHTPQKRIKEMMNHKYIDTGAVFGSELTFVRARDHKIFSIKEKKSTIRKGEIGCNEKERY